MSQRHQTLTFEDSLLDKSKNFSDNSKILLNTHKSSEYLCTGRSEVIEGVSGGVSTEVNERLQETIGEKLFLPHPFEYLEKSVHASPVCVSLINVDNIIAPYSYYKKVMNFVVLKMR